MKLTKSDGLIGALIYGAVKVVPQLQSEVSKLIVITLMLAAAVFIHFISLKYKKVQNDRN
jgi:hypothetical protein